MDPDKEEEKEAEKESATEHEEEQSADSLAAGPHQGQLLGWPIMIVPDGYKGRLPKTAWIYERNKAEAEKLYKEVESGSTCIKILENSDTANGEADVTYDGFREKVLKAIKRLMTTPNGRSLIKKIAHGGQDVTIRPSKTNLASTARGNTTNATNGVGTTSTIYFDPNFSDKTIKTYDKNGKELATPFFLALGHEMIHALHNQQGTNARNQAGSAAAWDNKEEENTIDGPGISENALRREHGLGQRYGHGGKVTSSRTKKVQGGGAGG